MRKIALERLYSFLENNLAVGYFCLMIAAAGIGAAWAKFQSLTGQLPQ